MDRRIQFLRSNEDEARYEARAAADLDAFFAACDERESSPEPDWEVQRRVLAMARSADLEPT